MSPTIWKGKPGSRRTSVVRFFQGVGEVLFPGGCAGCGGSLVRSEVGDLVLCSSCRNSLPWLSWPRCNRCGVPRGSGRTAADPCLECADWPSELAGASAPLALDGSASRVVHALKYEGRRGAARFMAECMVRGARSGGSIPSGALLVPIPTTPRRERTRGYNQARELARALSETTGIPWRDLLVRREGTESQIGLHPDERRANVSGVFQASLERGWPDPAGLILVDDVVTTGATALAAAGALAEEGAAGVRLWTFARTLADPAAGMSASP